MIYNSVQLQDMTSVTCGHFCINFIGKQMPLSFSDQQGALTAQMTENNKIVHSDFKQHYFFTCLFHWLKPTKL